MKKRRINAKGFARINNQEFDEFVVEKTCGSIALT